MSNLKAAHLNKFTPDHISDTCHTSQHTWLSVPSSDYNNTVVFILLWTPWRALRGPSVDTADPTLAMIDTLT